MLATKTEKRFQRKLWKAIQNSDEYKQTVCQLTQSLNKEVFERILFSVHPASGDSITHVISRHNQVKTLGYLHETYNIPLRVANLDGKEPLHEAASCGSLDVVSYLLNEGRVEDVDPLKRAGWTPLMMSATRPCNLPVVKILVEKGWLECFSYFLPNWRYRNGQIFIST